MQRYKGFYIRSTSLTGNTVPGLCIAAEYTCPRQPWSSDQRYTVFATTESAGCWATAMKLAEVSAAIDWCYEAASETQLVTWDGTSAIRMFSQYPLSDGTRIKLRTITESMVDLSLSRAVAGSDQGIPHLEDARPFPVLDWISGNRLQQLSCVSWAIEHLESLITNHIASMSIDSPAIRACLSPVGHLRNEQTLSAVCSPRMARRLSSAVSSEVESVNDPSFFL